MEDVKRIRVRREPANQETLKLVRHEGAVYQVGKPVAVVGYVGYWLIERFEVDEGGVWAVIAAIPYSIATFVASKRVRINNLLPLTYKHLTEEAARIREHLTFVEKLRNEIGKVWDDEDFDDAAFQ